MEKIVLFLDPNVALYLISPWGPLKILFWANIVFHTHFPPSLYGYRLLIGNLMRLDAIFLASS